MEENRAALSRLFSSGLIFTQKGSRAGRDLCSPTSAAADTRICSPGWRSPRTDDAALKHRAEKFSPT